MSAIQSVPGFVGNEAHPNGNLTGFANWEPSMSGKWLILFHEVAPQIERVGVLGASRNACPALGVSKCAEALTPAPKVKLGSTRSA